MCGCGFEIVLWIFMEITVDGKRLIGKLCVKPTNAWIFAGVENMIGIEFSTTLFDGINNSIC